MKRVSLLVFPILLLFTTFLVTAQQTPEADYPDFNELIPDPAWIRMNFPIDVEMIGFRSEPSNPDGIGLYLVQITNESGQVFGDSPDEDVDVWGYYPIQRRTYEQDGSVTIYPVTRWAMGRYGWQRPYNIEIPVGVSYLELDAPNVYISFNGRYSFQTGDTYTGPARDTYSPGGLALAPITVSYPQFSAEYNVITPEPIVIIPDYCFDFVFIQQGTYNYRIREEIADGVFSEIEYGVITWGQNFEWVAPFRGRFTFEIDEDTGAGESWVIFSLGLC